MISNAEQAWRQHGIKLRQNLEKQGKKIKEEAQTRNKEMYDEIKFWRKKSTGVLEKAHVTAEMFKMAAEGKPIPEAMQNGGGGADAVWAEVFQCQENQKDKAKEALAMMEGMNAQADECNAEMKKQTEKFKENISKAEAVQAGLKEGMDKLKTLAGGGMKDPIMACCCICSCVMCLGALAIVGGVW